MERKKEKAKTGVGVWELRFSQFSVAWAEGILVVCVVFVFGSGQPWIEEILSVILRSGQETVHLGLLFFAKGASTTSRRKGAHNNAFNSLEHQSFTVS